MNVTPGETLIESSVSTGSIDKSCQHALVAQAEDTGDDDQIRADTKKTRRVTFLEEMEQVVPWGKLCELLDLIGTAPTKIAKIACEFAEWHR